MSATERVDTVIVGAGFAGLAAALALRAAGVESFVILEQAPDIGGTWRDNTYPGVACDVPAHLYGLSSRPWPEWSQLFAPGAEVRSYLDRTVREEGLRSRIRLNTPMAEARWTADGWALWTTAGGPLESGGDGPARGRVDPPDLLATHLVLGAGRLTEPRIPNVPGLGTFSGPMFHSARWRHDVEAAGKRVAVVGSGASAIQIAPELARGGARVTLFQRTPAWVMPRGNRPHDAQERRRLAADPAALHALRAHLYAEGEARFASRSGDAEASATARDQALAHLAAQVPDPALRDLLTPRYTFGCKRVLLSDDFYPAIASGAVQLEPSTLARVSGSTLTAASGAEYEADVLVLATGFEAARQPYATLVTGEHGLTLDEHWYAGMTSVGSTLVHGFPDLFVLGGPNAALGHNSAVLVLEAQAAFAASLIARGASRPLRVTAEAEAEYTAEIVTRSAGTPWMSSSCHSWYVDPRSGRLTLLWPGTVAAFRDRLGRLHRELTGAPDVGDRAARPRA